MTMLDDLSSLPPEGYLEISSEINERTQLGDLYWDHDDEEWLPIPRMQLDMYVASFCRVARKQQHVAIGCKVSRTLIDRQQTPFVKRILRTRGPK